MASIVACGSSVLRLGCSCAGSTAGRRQSRRMDRTGILNIVGERGWVNLALSLRSSSQTLLWAYVVAAEKLSRRRGALRRLNSGSCLRRGGSPVNNRDEDLFYSD